jgi:hypothetical protein
VINAPLLWISPNVINESFFLINWLFFFFSPPLISPLLFYFLSLFTHLLIVIFSLPATIHRPPTSCLSVVLRHRICRPFSYFFSNSLCSIKDSSFTTADKSMHSLNKKSTDSWARSVRRSWNQTRIWARNRILIKKSKANPILEIVCSDE